MQILYTRIANISLQTFQRKCNLDYNNCLLRTYMRVIGGGGGGGGEGGGATEQP